MEGGVGKSMLVIALLTLLAVGNDKVTAAGAATVSEAVPQTTLSVVTDAGSTSPSTTTLDYTAEPTTEATADTSDELSTIAATTETSNHSTESTHQVTQASTAQSTSESSTAEVTQATNAQTTPDESTATDRTDEDVTGASTVTRKVTDITTHGASSGASTTATSPSVPSTTTVKAENGTTEKKPASGDGGGGLSSGAQAGIAICVIVAMLAIGLGGFYFYKRHKGDKPYETLDDYGAVEGLQNPTYDVDL